jgi:CRP-like cAMP-binding protein
MNLFTPNRLPPELRQAIVSRTLATGQYLFRQGDSATSFFTVETGRLKIFRHTPEQRVVTLQIARAGGSFGESALFSDFYSYSAGAEVPSHVIAYPKQPLLAVLRDYPDLAEDFMTLLVAKKEALVLQLELRDIRAAHTRVLQYLRYLAQPNDTTVVRFDRPLKNIAADLGLTPATLSRALARLEREGMIIREHSLITLRDSSAA